MESWWPIMYDLAFLSPPDLLLHGLVGLVCCSFPYLSDLSISLHIFPKIFVLQFFAEQWFFLGCLHLDILCMQIVADFTDKMAFYEHWVFGRIGSLFFFFIHDILSIIVIVHVWKASFLLWCALTEYYRRKQWKIPLVIFPKKTYQYKNSESLETFNFQWLHKLK